MYTCNFSKLFCRGQNQVMITKEKWVKMWNVPWEELTFWMSNSIK